LLLPCLGIMRKVALVVDNARLASDAQTNRELGRIYQDLLGCDGSKDIKSVCTLKFRKALWIFPIILRRIITGLMATPGTKTLQ
jgi:hypothetical protein